MPVAHQVPVAEYLATTYRPDRDYVDGGVIERNVGEHTHARAQGCSLSLLMAEEKRFGVRALPEQRIQV